MGIHKEIENKVINSFSLCVKAVYENKNSKLQTLEMLRVEIEVLKQLIRVESEIKIISDKTYIALEKDLQEISKMTNGWLKYIKTQNPA